MRGQPTLLLLYSFVTSTGLACSCASSSNTQDDVSEVESNTGPASIGASTDDGDEGDGDNGDTDDTGDTGEGDGDADNDDTGDGDGDTGNDNDDTGDGDGELILWPLSQSADPDADPISDPYGPRHIGVYDFHAGIDLPTDIGTPVHAVMEGFVVAVNPWDGESSSGNSILISHPGERYTAYLHLSAIQVDVDHVVQAGDQIALSGDTGANLPHLHLTYMRELPGNWVDERLSHNPLSLLPSLPPPAIVSSWDTGEVSLMLTRQNMWIQSFALGTDAQTIEVDYAQIVELGSVERDNQDQFGAHLEVEDINSELFILRLRASGAGVSADTVQLWDFNGDPLVSP